MITISVVIPAYNEEQGIAETVGAAWAIPGVIEVVVVDDGSHDNTAVAAREAGGEVFVLPGNVGKGGALSYGIARTKGGLILLLDGDLGVTALEGRKLAESLLSGEAEMAIGRFPVMGKRAGFGFTLGLARFGTKYLTGLIMEAPLSGQRAFTREALQQLLPLLPGFGVEVGLNVRAGRRGLRVVEVPVNMSHRFTTGDYRGVRHRARQFWHILQALVQLAREQ